MNNVCLWENRRETKNCDKRDRNKFFTYFTLSQYDPYMTLYIVKSSIFFVNHKMKRAEKCFNASFLCSYDKYLFTCKNARESWIIVYVVVVFVRVYMKKIRCNEIIMIWLIFFILIEVIKSSCFVCVCVFVCVRVCVRLKLNCDV